MKLVILSWQYPECKYSFHAWASSRGLNERPGLYGATYLLVTLESAREDYGLNI